MPGWLCSCRSPSVLSRPVMTRRSFHLRILTANRRARRSRAERAQIGFGFGQQLETARRPGVSNASDTASDFYEEVIVNPTLLGPTSRCEPEYLSLLQHQHALGASSFFGCAGALCHLRSFATRRSWPT